jgi:hypothetical protein
MYLTLTPQFTLWKRENPTTHVETSVMQVFDSVTPTVNGPIYIYTDLRDNQALIEFYGRT